MKAIDTCITKPFCGQTLGALINPILERIAGLETLGAIAECPIESLMTGNVQFNICQLDILEDFLSEETEAIAKYLQKPNANAEYAKKKLSRLVVVQKAIQTMRTDKCEIWLQHIYPLIRAAQREFGLAGNVQINFPLRFGVNQTLYLDFINGRATAWMR